MDTAKHRGKGGGIVILSIIVIGLTILYHAAIPSIKAIPARILAMCAIQLALIAAVLVVNGKHDHQPVSALGYAKDGIGRQIGYGVIISVVLSVLFIGIPALLGISITGVRDALWFAIPYQMVFVGFSEETLFRGYYLDRIRTMAGSVPAIVLSSLMFGAWHAIGPLVSGSEIPWLQMLVTAVIGAILAVFRMYAPSATTLSCALAHGAYNSLIRIISVL